VIFGFSFIELAKHFGERMVRILTLKRPNSIRVIKLEIFVRAR